MKKLLSVLMTVAIILCPMTVAVFAEEELPMLYFTGSEENEEVVEDTGDIIDCIDFGTDSTPEIYKQDAVVVWVHNNSGSLIETSQIKCVDEFITIDFYGEDSIPNGGKILIGIKPNSDYEFEVGGYSYYIAAYDENDQIIGEILYVNIDISESEFVSFGYDADYSDWYLPTNYADVTRTITVENTGEYEITVVLENEGDALILFDGETPKEIPLAVGESQEVEIKLVNGKDKGVYPCNILIGDSRNETVTQSVEFRAIVQSDLENLETKSEVGDINSKIDDIASLLAGSTFDIEGGTLAEKIENLTQMMLEQLDIPGSIIEAEPMLLDIVPKKKNGSGNWVDAEECDFAEGKVPVSIDMSANGITYDSATQDVSIIHAFTTSWGGNSIGDHEVFSTHDGTIQINNGCLEFEMTGCSPILICVTQKMASVNGYGDGDIVLAGPFTYDSDINMMLTPDEDNDIGSSLEYGKPVYYLILDKTEGGANGVPLTDYSFVEKMKVKSEWNMGNNAIESVSIVKKSINAADTLIACNRILDDEGFGSDYYYFLEIKTKEMDSTSETDVQGVIEFDRKANNKKLVQKIKDSTADIDFSLFYSNNWKTQGEIVDGAIDLEWDTKYALKFNSDDEVELSFGSPNGGNNEGTFTVDASGQGKVVLCYNTNPVEAIEKANPDADMDFVIFNDVKFNRAGEFVYEKENGTHAYRIVNGKLVEIAGLTVDGDELKFNTSLLGGFVFADRELVNP